MNIRIVNRKTIKTKKWICNRKLNIETYVPNTVICKDGWEDGRIMTFHHTEEAKMKISLSMTGENNPSYIDGRTNKNKKPCKFHRGDTVVYVTNIKENKIEKINIKNLQSYLDNGYIKGNFKNKFINS